MHESAYVDDGAAIGAGTKVWHFCHVLGGAVIGERCSLGQNVVVMNGMRIGDNVKIQNNVSIYEGVELEDDVFCGPSMVFTNVLNPRSHVSRKNEYRRHSCGAARRSARTRRSSAARRSASTRSSARARSSRRDVPDYALMVGVPARRIGWMCQCGERLAATAATGTVRRRAASTYEPTAGGDRAAPEVRA